MDRDTLALLRALAIGGSGGRSGSITVDLPPWGVAIFVPDDGTIRNYRFCR